MGILNLITTIILCLMFLIGVMLIVSNSKPKQQKAKLKKGLSFTEKKTTNWGDSFLEDLQDNELDKKLNMAALHITSNQYNFVRLIILLLILIVMVVQMLSLNYNTAIRTGIVLIIIYIGSHPNRKLFGKYTTPAGFVIKKLIDNYQTKVDTALFNTVTQLRNLVESLKDNPMGSEFILSQIYIFSDPKYTKPIFTNFIMLLRDDTEKARMYFIERTNTKIGKELANMLTKLDVIDPIELKQQLENMQNKVRKEKITIADRKQKSMGLFLYISSNVGIFIIFMFIAGLIVKTVMAGAF